MKFISKKIALASLITMASVPTANAGDWNLTVFAGSAESDSLSEVCGPFEIQANVQLIVAGVNARATCTVDDSDTSLGLTLGYDFNETWGLELGYADLGEYVVELDILGQTTNINLDASAPYIAGVGTLKLSEKFSLSARLGVYKASLDLSVDDISGSEEEFESDEEAYAGVSVNYKLTDTISAQLRYDDFDEFSSTGLGVKFSF